MEKPNSTPTVTVPFAHLEQLLANDKKNKIILADAVVFKDILINGLFNGVVPDKEPSGAELMKILYRIPALYRQIKNNLPILQRFTKSLELITELTTNTPT